MRRLGNTKHPSAAGCLVGELSTHQGAAHPGGQFVAGEGRVLALAAQAGGLGLPVGLRVKDHDVGHAALGELTATGLQGAQG